MPDEIRISLRDCLILDEGIAALDEFMHYHGNFEGLIGRLRDLRGRCVVRDNVGAVRRGDVVDVFPVIYGRDIRYSDGIPGIVVAVDDVGALIDVVVFGDSHAADLLKGVARRGEAGITAWRWSPRS